MILGLVLMAVGHFLMVIKSLFFVGLLLIVTGSGFFKPNMVRPGMARAASSCRRDCHFTDTPSSSMLKRLLKSRRRLAASRVTRASPLTAAFCVGGPTH